MYRFFLLGIFTVLLFSSASFVEAVEVPGSANLLSIGLSPQNPRPYGTVTITPQSTLLSLSEHTIQILVNGTEIEKGTGKVSARATLGAPGTPTTIKVVATNASGVASSAQITLRPADVALVVEPNTTTHPFYEGGKLVAPESPIRVVAITDFRNASGAQISPASLVYTWKFGDRILERDSGVGRSVLSAIAPIQYRDANISLVVSSPDGSLVGEASIVISPTNPFVLLYQHDPLLGVIFTNALSKTFSMPGAETTFRAIAYYLGTPVTYSWKVNNAPSGTGNDLTVRANGSGEGTASLGVGALDQQGRSATNILSVLFGNNPSSGIFGL